MTVLVETNAAIVNRLFKAPDAPLGQAWLDTVTPGWTEASLHHLVVTTGTPLSAAKAKEVYGHFRTKQQRNGISGPYWTQDLTVTPNDEFVRLNTTTDDGEKRLLQLRTDKIGGVLVATRMLDADGTSTGPFITIVAAPSVMTHLPPVGENGLIFEDVWDPAVLSRFAPLLDMEKPHCPLMGAQEGFIRMKKFKPGMVQFLQESQPLLFPAGEQMCEQVTCEEIISPRTIFLPEVCNLPLGMRWPMDIGLTDFKKSIQAALGQAGTVFNEMLATMDAMLDCWFKAVGKFQARFSIQSCPFLSFYDLNYPAIDNGSWPDVVTDTEGFSPLLDMLNGYLWRLWCDRMLTTASKVNRKHLVTYLDIGDTVVKTGTYLGVDYPGRFCPNFAYHLKVTNGWPTDTGPTKFLQEFLHLPLLSYQAQQYDPVEADLHQPTLVISISQTREERMSELHKSRTPKTSVPRKMTPVKTSARYSATSVSGTPNAKSSGLLIPSEVKKFSPFSPLASEHTSRSYGSSRMDKTPRNLESDLLSGMVPESCPAAVTGATGPVCLKPAAPNAMTSTIYTTQGREVATDPFLNVCRLLAHHSTRRSLLVGSDQLPAEAHIFAREPCGLFRREILVNIQKTSSTGGFMPSFLSYMEAVLRPAQIQLSGVYDPKFFSAAFLHAFLSVETWMVSDYILPEHVPPATFHVYKLVSCLQKFAGHPLLLPSTGLSLLEAKQIGILVYYLFAMMDLSDDGMFNSAKFAGSILGQRLKAWSALPDSAMIHGLWNRAPLQVTFHWFASLQSILSTAHRWIKQLRYHPAKGFFHARDAEGTRYLLLDNKVPSNIPGRNDAVTDLFRTSDMLFETRWFGGSFLDPLWSTPIPVGHSVAAPIFQKQPTNDHIQQDTHEYGAYKRQKLGGKKLQAPDFVSSTPLMETIVPLPPNTRSATMALVRRISAPVAFPRLQADNGTFQTVCLNSAFQAPYNCCILRLCGDKKSTPRIPRLHIDLYKEPWKSKPESYWAPMVAFLQHAAVIPHIKPTAALKLATPGTVWA
jgi:hypothetical protein